MRRLGSQTPVSVPTKHLNPFFPTLSYGEFISHTAGISFEEEARKILNAPPPQKRPILRLRTTFVTFQDGAVLEPTRRQPLIHFSRLEHAQAADEHTEQPTTQLERVSFVDAIIRPLIEQP